MSMKLHDNVTGFQHMGFPTNDLAETVAFMKNLIPRGTSYLQ